MFPRSPRSEVELQRELDLPRVVRTVFGARRRTEQRRRKVRVHAVAAAEIGVVRQVEELRSELESRAFRGTDVLEQRPVEAMEPRPCELRRGPAERREVTLPNCRGNRRIGKRLRVCPLIDVVRPSEDVL